MSRLAMGPASHYAHLVKMLRDHSNSDECLEWPYSRDKGGYGVVQFREKANRAHKVAFFITYGGWAKPFTLHTCDNTACFNPRHLYAGSAKDNAVDRVARGQQPRGERQGLAVLTDELVREIRRQYKYRDGGYAALAKRFRISAATAYQVVSRKTWRHI